MGEVAETIRNEDGTFKKGVSGNPAGRPKGRKNQLTVLKQDLEIAVREHVKPRQIKSIMDKMVELALEGNIGAAKIILDKTVTNARDSEDTQEGNSGWTFVVKNVTVQKEAPSDEGEIIDVTPTEE